MTLLDQLIQNKGTVSSALSKQLANDILKGQIGILSEAIKLIHHDSKNVRSEASKIVEKVAEEKPNMLVRNIESFIEVLNYPEPQTRWMMIHTIGLCANLNPEKAIDIFDEVVKYLNTKVGTVLRDRAITYLGYIGTISEQYCKKSYPYLIQAMTSCPDRITRIFESIYRMTENLTNEMKIDWKESVNYYLNDGSPAEKSWAKKLIKIIN